MRGPRSDSMVAGRGFFIGGGGTDEIASRIGGRGLSRDRRSLVQVGRFGGAPGRSLLERLASARNGAGVPARRRVSRYRLARHGRLGGGRRAAQGRRVGRR